MEVNTLTEIKKVVVFTGGMKTKIVNAAETYQLTLPKVKALYLEAVNEILHSKNTVFKEPEDIGRAYRQFTSDDYRQIWFHFVEKCQNVVKSEGGSRKGQITKLENKAKGIVEKDLRRLKIRIGKLKAQLAGADKEDRKLIKERIKKYEDFIKYADSDRALNHFVNKVKVNPDLTSFIFKAANWNNVVNI